MKELIEFKRQFDPQFFAYLNKCIGRILVHYPEFLPVGEHLAKLARGGKRLRPFILDLGYRSGDGSDYQSILPALFATEIFHLFALIHDDIIDNSKFRHGVETIHSCFDIKQAILVGDQCFAWAMGAIALAPKIAQKELDIFLRLSEETITGQMIDVSLSKRRDVSESVLSTSVELKTARYTFIYPTLLGLSYAGYCEDTVSYTSFNSHLGHAFQRLNDLSDIMSEQAEFGKKLGSDISENTTTHLSGYFDTHSTEGQKAIFAVYRGSPLDHNDILRVRELFSVTGAIDNERKEIGERLSSAQDELASIPMPENCRDTWQSLIDYMRGKISSIS